MSIKSVKCFITALWELQRHHIVNNHYIKEIRLEEQRQGTAQKN